ncbi:hypothetical protein ES703_90710 [subsurface metagenome]
MRKKIKRGGKKMKRILVISILILSCATYGQDVIKQYDDSAMVTTIKTAYDHISLMDFYRYQPRLNIEIRFPGEVLRNGSKAIYYFIISRVGKEQKFKNTQDIQIRIDGRPFSIPVDFYLFERFNGGDVFESIHLDIESETLKRIAFISRVQFNISGIKFIPSKREKNALGMALFEYEKSVIDTLKKVMFDVHSNLKNRVRQLTRDHPSLSS